MPKAANGSETRPGVLARNDPRKRTVLISLLGLKGCDREAAINLIARALPREETPVFVTDDPDFAPLAAAGHLYEYFPPLLSQANFADGPSWEHYLARRLRLLLEKWAPVRVVAAGTTFDEYIRQRGATQ